MILTKIDIYIIKIWENILNELYMCINLFIFKLFI